MAARKRARPAVAVKAQEGGTVGSGRGSGGCEWQGMDHLRACSRTSPLTPESALEGAWGPNDLTQGVQHTTCDIRKFSVLFREKLQYI